MQVLLRTASTYARACSEAAQSIEVRPTIKLTIHQRDAVQQLHDEAETAAARIRDVVELHKTRMEIRTLIGKANDSSVDALLTERECYLNIVEKYLSSLIDNISGSERERRRRVYGNDSSTLAHDPAEIQRALENLQSRLSTVTTGDATDSVEVPVLPKAEIDNLRTMVAAIRRRRSVLNDELAAANLKHHITLSESVVNVLRKHQIID